MPAPLPAANPPRRGGSRRLKVEAKMTSTDRFLRSSRQAPHNERITITRTRAYESPRVLKPPRVVLLCMMSLACSAGTPETAGSEGVATLLLTTGGTIGEGTGTDTGTGTSVSTSYDTSTSTGDEEECDAWNDNCPSGLKCMPVGAGGERLCSAEMHARRGRA